MENKQDVGATEFDLRDHNQPEIKFKANYGNRHVPRPTNAPAKVTYADKVMKAVLEAK